MANYDSKERRDFKHDAATKEEAWKGAGTAVGTQVWRIEKMKVVNVDKTDYGHFFTGDTYIVLHTFKKKGPDGKETDALAHAEHFWLGKKAPVDARGTAAYKTVELDDLLSGDAPQHRETQGHESKEFLDLFTGSIQILEGGHGSGFHHVKPHEYKPRLLHLIGAHNKHIRVTQVDAKGDNLSQGDVFVLDAGLELFQWNGGKSNIWQKRQADEIVRKTVHLRDGKPKHTVLDSGDDNADFWKHLGGKVTPKDAPAAGSTGGGGDGWHKDSVKVLYKVTAVAGKEAKFDVVVKAGDKVTKDKLNSKEVYVLDVTDEGKNHHAFVWVGKDAPKETRKRALLIGEDFIRAFKLPDETHINRCVEGGHHGVSFTSALDA